MQGIIMHEDLCASLTDTNVFRLRLKKDPGQTVTGWYNDLM